MPKKVVLYRLFNRRNDLLYVGVTSDLKTRLATHANKKEWWPDVDQRKTTATPYDDHDAAFAAEAMAIIAEHPRYNKVGKPGGNHERVGVNAATKAAMANAQRRRFQRYLREMRAAGLVVEVQTTDFNQSIVHPDYTVEATGR